ncbi:tubulin epsilon and delta complex protein 2 [Echinops telfairi]|uniref:Tubulin epsilon and delta complex protein 2 n=1 Tax=Echinops telfairi TaxID=9371 RepID=A0AC55CQH5_ECHTE|nr:tubulin epsilon and delta complex protein 2 [Echinops telfairi]
MLPADSSRRLVAELQGALDACAEQEQQLDQSLRVCRRLLGTWKPAGVPEPEPSHEDPSPGAPSPQDLKELELLTQALEKAVRVRKSPSKTAERAKVPNQKPRTKAPTAPAPPQAPGRTSSHTSVTRPTRSSHQPKVLTTGHQEHRLRPAQERATLGTGARATKPSLGDPQVTSAAPRGPEVFTLKEKGSLLRLPLAFQKTVSQNSRLWAQLTSTQASDTEEAAARARFLQKMQAASGRAAPGLSMAQVEAEVGTLRRACWLLRLHMNNETAAAPADWVQEYRRVLTLEGLQTMAGQCLRRLQELRQAVAGQQLDPWPLGKPPQACPCRGGADANWKPQLLLYSSTRELQSLVAHQLHTTMLAQQLHLQKVLMAELLPLVRGTPSPSRLALCRAVHSLLCDGGQHFPVALRDEPAD